MRPGWIACRTAFRTARPPRRCERFANSASANFRQSFRHVASDGTDLSPRRLTHVTHRVLPRPPLRATPWGAALRSRVPPMHHVDKPPAAAHEGRVWTRNGGWNCKRFDTLAAVMQVVAGLIVVAGQRE